MKRILKFKRESIVTVLAWWGIYCNQFRIHVRDEQRVVVGDEVVVAVVVAVAVESILETDMMGQPVHIIWGRNIYVVAPFSTTAPLYIPRGTSS